MLNYKHFSFKSDTTDQEYGLAHSVFLLSALIGALKILSVLAFALTSPLKKLPGPPLASFTSWYRVWLFASGEAPVENLNLHQIYGPIVRTGPNTVSISDVTAIPTIYGITSHFIKSRFYTTLTPTYNGIRLPGLFATADPAAHKALKKPVAAKYSMTSICTLQSFVDECTATFMSSMKKHEGEVIDLSTWLQCITFAKPFGFLKEEKDIKSMISITNFGLTYAGLVGLVPWLHPYLLGNMPLLKVLDLVFSLGDKDPARLISNMAHKCMEEYHDRDQEGFVSDRPDFLGWLKKEKDKRDSSLTDNDIMSHLMTNLFAGSDTTSISLSTVFYMIARKSEIYRKLQHEIDEADSQGKLSNSVTYAESLELKYLQAVIKEALRFHPAVQYPIERIVPPEGIEICGFTLPPGTIVSMNPYVVHRDTSIFGKDAAEFRPERWLDSSSAQISMMERSFMAFGYGSRTCIGKNISIMEMGKFIPQILRYFDIEWASENPEWNVSTYWFAKQSGIRVRIEQRKRTTA